MADILGRADSVLGGAFSADAGSLTFSGLTDAVGAAGAVGLIIQNIGLQYRQEVRQIFEVGSPARYYVAGRTNGGLNLGRVVGPVGIQRAFYARYGNVCNAAQNIVQLGIGAGCASGDSAPVAVGNDAFTAYNAVLTDLGMTVAAQDMLINESMSMIFGELR